MPETHIWISNAPDYITNTGFIDEIPDAPNASHIESLWKINPVINGGYPYITLMPDLEELELHPIEQRKYICVYCPRQGEEHTIYPSIEEMVDDTGATTNGDAILTPTSCEVTETRNGMWSVSMTHPIDPEGRYKYIKINSILKVMGQLFTIKKVDEKWTGNSGRLSVYAEHIFYQLADGWIQPIKRVIASTGQEAINYSAMRVDWEDREDPPSFNYPFDGHSDLDFNGRVFVKTIENGCTFLECLLGSSGLIEQFGGELYRNNFYYSINERMENAGENSFDIRVGKNLSGIDRTIDLSSMISHFTLYDSYGSYVSYAWNFSTFFGDLFPHYIVRSETVSVPQQVEDGDMPYSQWFDSMFPQCDAMLAKYGKPMLCYDITLEDVRNNPDFAYIGDESIRVGDKGTLYDVRFDSQPITVEITETVYDALTGKCKRVTIGDKQSFVSTSMPTIDFNITPSPEVYESPILDADGKFIFDADGKQIIQGGVLNA